MAVEIDWVFLDGEPPERLFCQICADVFDDPQLMTCCGESFCKKCNTSFWEKMRLVARPICPKCKSTQFEMLSNTPLENSISMLMVQCPMKESGCEFTGTLKDGKHHLGSECGFTHIHCPNKCGAPTFPRSQLVKHVEKCPLEVVVCPFAVVGCDSAGPQPRKDVTSHELSQINKHLLSVVEYNKKSARKTQTLMKALQEDHEKKVKSKFVLLTDLTRKLETAESAITNLDAKLQAAQMKLLKMNDEKQKNAASFDRYSALNLQRAEESKEILVALEEQVQTLPIPTDGTGILHIPVTFTMDRFSERLSCGYQWVSPPFYSHNGGYKLCLSVNANGDHEAHGNHVSIFLHTMTGEFDDHLEWPMPDCIVTVVAMNQKNVLSKYLFGSSGSARHDIWLASGNSIAMRSKVLNGHYGTGWGKRNFIPHSEVSQYLTNDEMTIKVYSIQFLPF